MKKKKMLITLPKGHIRDSFIPADVCEKLNSMYDVTCNPSCEQYSDEMLRQELKNAEICMTGWGCRRLDENVLDTAEKLRLVAHTGGSVAQIVSDCLFDRKIMLISGNNVYAESVAEGTLAYILCALREIPLYSNNLQEGKWKDECFQNEGLLENDVGLVGFGATAKFLVTMLVPFRVRIKAYDPYVSAEMMRLHGVTPSSLEEIFSTCRVISIHAPRTKSTYHMIDRRLLGLIKNAAVLVNTSRGSLIDEEALADELSSGRFKAILDVFETEPLSKESRLLGLKNAILIPHMAGPTIDRRKNVTLALIEDVERFYRNEPQKHEISKDYAAGMTQ